MHTSSPSTKTTRELDATLVHQLTATPSPIASTDTLSSLIEEAKDWNNEWTAGREVYKIKVGLGAREGVEDSVECGGRDAPKVEGNERQPETRGDIKDRDERGMEGSKENGEGSIKNGSHRDHSIESRVEIENSKSNSGTEVKKDELECDEIFILRDKLEMLSEFTQKEFAYAEIRGDPLTTKNSILNCPWAILPFVFSMFTLVHALKMAGWIDSLASYILEIIPADQGNSIKAIATATFLMTTISFVLCSLIDNQPASILLTQVLIAPSFSRLPTMVRTSGMFGVLEGANIGGCWSIMGALAGIMWSTLLRNKGIYIGYLQFLKIGLRVMPLVTGVVALLICGEAILRT